MTATLVFAAALAASSAGPALVGSGAAHQLVSANGTEASIASILASDEYENRDPATLINLGAAYARIGQKDRALAMYRAAIASPDRYDLQLADGRWLDSRAAARLAAAELQGSGKLVLR